jgi:glycosyltransferase involved in cell wall biosynthesis
MPPQVRDVSVVVPLLNEEDNIRTLYGQVSAALEGKFDFEVIFVDDGSTDSSFNILKELAGRDSRVRVLRLRKNFGQTAAMTAGFNHALGKVIVPCDCDLQNDPADIPRLVAELDKGYDIVSGWRKERHDKAVTRRLPSMLANKMIAAVTKVKLHDFGCTLKAYRREVLEETRLYGEMHRFIPALASWSGAKVGELVVNHRPRTAGVAKYGLGRTFKVVLDLITVKFLGSYSTKPIYIFGGIGIYSALAGFLCGLGVLYYKFFADPPIAMNRNPLLILTALLFTTSFQFILMGLLAEILVRTYHESKGRPTYVIKEIVENTAASAGIK